MRYGLLIICQYAGDHFLPDVAKSFEKVCDLLVKYKQYDKMNIKVCTDTSHEDMRKYLPDENIKPATEESIKHEIESTMSKLQHGDRLFFYYLGHGILLHDHTGDEFDGKDSCLLTSDLVPIRDDYLYLQMVLKVPKGAVLNAFFKACHSGSILDIPILFNSGEEQEKPISHLTNMMLGQRLHFTRPIITDDIGLTFQISSCLDHEKSAMYRKYIIAGNFVSIFTKQLVKTIRKMDERSTYKDLIQSMNERLDFFPDQHFAVCISHRINLDSPFLI